VLYHSSVSSIQHCTLEDYSKTSNITIEAID